MFSDGSNGIMAIRSYTDLEAVEAVRFTVCLQYVCREEM